MNSKHKTHFVILAAGKATRMQQPKQLLPFGESSILQTVIETVRNSNCSEFSVVLGAYANEIQRQLPEEIKMIYNPNFADGLSTSIVKAVEECDEANHLGFVLGDQPLLEVEDINYMIRQSQRNPEKIICANYNGRGGVPAIFPKSFFSKLLAIKGDKGARQLLQNEKENCILVELTSLDDVDTPQDYQRITQRMTAQYKRRDND